MSKRKIDETMTEARTDRAKKARTVTHEPVVEEKPVEVAKPKRGKKDPVPDETAPQEDLVVFAFRLKAAERDLIHKAAGAAKASRFVRALTIAAASGDEKTVVAITRAVKEELAVAAS